MSKIPKNQPKDHFAKHGVTRGPLPSFAQDLCTRDTPSRDAGGDARHHANSDA